MKAAKLILLSFVLSGCVSIDIGAKHMERASGVKFTQPSAPFEKSSASSVDAIWRNPKNGNAISYLSDCGDNSDPSLANIEREGY